VKELAIQPKGEIEVMTFTTGDYWTWNGLYFEHHREPMAITSEWLTRVAKWAADEEERTSLAPMASRPSGEHKTKGERD